MNSEFETLIYDAEDAYLQSQDVEQFQQHMASLAQRLEIYELLRDREIHIFQPIADQLQATFPQESPELLVRTVKHGLSVLRYCAMAMLLGNSDYLQRRLLEWLPGQIQAHQLESLALHMFQLIQEQLTSCLSSVQMTFIKPYIAQAQRTVVDISEQDCAMVMS